MVKVQVYYYKYLSHQYSCKKRYKLQIYGQKKYCILKFILRITNYFKGAGQRFDLDTANYIKRFAHYMECMAKIRFKS